jgi:phytoene dehydrogenase-like protein
MLNVGHFRVVESQLKVGGMCTTTSYGGLQLETCMYLLVFFVIGSLFSHAIIVEQVA